jgi:hypothetical protein
MAVELVLTFRTHPYGLEGTEVPHLVSFRGTTGRLLLVMLVMVVVVVMVVVPLNVPPRVGDIGK